MWCVVCVVWCVLCGVWCVCVCVCVCVPSSRRRCLLQNEDPLSRSGGNKFDFGIPSPRGMMMMTMMMREVDAGGGVQWVGSGAWCRRGMGVDAGGGCRGCTGGSPQAGCELGGPSAGKSPPRRPEAPQGRSRGPPRKSRGAPAEKTARARKLQPDLGRKSNFPTCHQQSL